MVSLRQPTATATISNCITHGVSEVLRRQDVQKEINRVVRYHYHSGAITQYDSQDSRWELIAGMGSEVNENSIR